MNSWALATREDRRYSELKHEIKGMYDQLMIDKETIQNQQMAIKDLARETNEIKDMMLHLTSHIATLSADNTPQSPTK